MAQLRIAQEEWLVSEKRKDKNKRVDAVIAFLGTGPQGRTGPPGLSGRGNGREKEDSQADEGFLDDRKIERKIRLD